MHLMLNYKSNINNYVSVKRWHTIMHSQAAVHSSQLHLWIVVNIILLWPHGPWCTTSCIKFSCRTNYVLKVGQTTFRYPALDSKILVAVLLEYIDLFKFCEQSTAIILVGLSPVSPSHSYTTVLHDVAKHHYYY